MQVKKHLDAADGTLVSFEILPPLKGKSIKSLYRTLDPLMEFKPSFINVTYHRSEYKFKQNASGLYEKSYTRKRPGTVGIVAAIRYKYKVSTVPHLICGGFSKEQTEDALIDLDFLGINNVLALRGDPVHGESTFTPEVNGNQYAYDLVKQIRDMNNGIYMEELKNPQKTKFSIGVAGYPEKHLEAPSMAKDIEHLKAKVELGADYIMTQMFFDNEKFFSFVKQCREAGIEVPIIPGLKPLSRKSQVTALPRIFSVDIPKDLQDAMEGAKDEEGARQVGIEWCIQQSKELKEFGVPCLHYYTMGKVDNMIQVMRGLNS